MLRIETCNAVSNVGGNGGGHDLPFSFSFFLKRERKKAVLYNITNDSSIFTGNCFPSFERVPFYILQRVFRFREFRARERMV